MPIKTEGKHDWHPISDTCGAPIKVVGGIETGYAEEIVGTATEMCGRHCAAIRVTLTGEPENEIIVDGGKLVEHQAGGGFNMDLRTARAKFPEFFPKKKP